MFNVVVLKKPDVLAVFYDPKCGVNNSQSIIPVKPYVMLSCCSWERRKLPTNSHVSATSKLPIATSHVVGPFFCQCWFLYVSIELLA